jgi:hypothetical protein
MRLMKFFTRRVCFTNTHCRRLLSALLVSLFCLYCNEACAQFGLIGTGTTSNTATTYPTPFGAYYSGQRAQYLYLASELSVAGVLPGTISAIAYYVTATNGAGAHDDFTISICPTIQSSLSTWATTSFTQVYYSRHFTPTLGWNIIFLQQPYVWNGTSNIVIEVCHWNGVSTSTFNASVLQSNVFNASVINDYSHTTIPCGNNSLTPIIYNTRPNIRIGTLPLCKGQPSAGTLVPFGTVIACPANAYTITAINYSIAGNTSFRWKQSTDGGATWVPAAGGSGDTTFLYTTPPLSTDSISYHMVITCPTYGLSDSTANVTFRITQPVYAALPFGENFENWISRCDTAEVPSIHWTNAPYTGNQSWRRDDSGTRAAWTSPASGAYAPPAIAGLHSARFHANAAPTGPSGAGNLAAYIDCSSVAGIKALAFYLRTDTGHTQPTDSLFVDLSKNGGSAFTTIAAYGPGTGGWDLKTLAVASDSPKTVIRFRAFSQFQGYSDIGIDSVTVLPPVLPMGILSAQAQDFHIMPNPANGHINIYSKRSGVVQLIDITGRQIKSVMLRAGGGMTSVTLEGIAPGLYTYRYLADGIQMAVGKLVIAQ